MMLDGMAILNLPVPPLPLLPTRRTFKMFLTREVGGGETFLGSVFEENFITKTKRGDSKMNEFLKEARKYVVRSM